MSMRFFRCDSVFVEDNGLTAGRNSRLVSNRLRYLSTGYQLQQGVVTRRAFPSCSPDLSEGPDILLLHRERSKPERPGVVVGVGGRPWFREGGGPMVDRQRKNEKRERERKREREGERKKAI